MQRDGICRGGLFNSSIPCAVPGATSHGPTWSHGLVCSSNLVQEKKSSSPVLQNRELFHAA